jgi:hypothetical protein
MKTKCGSRLDISPGYQIDIVIVHGSTYITVLRISRYVYVQHLNIYFNFCTCAIIGNWLLLVGYLHLFA